MDKEAISCRGPLLHVPKERGPQLTEGRWGDQGLSAGTAQPWASHMLDTSVVILTISLLVVSTLSEEALP